MRYYKKNSNKLRCYNRNRQRRLKDNNPTDYYDKLGKRIDLWKIKNPEKVKAYRIVFVEIRAKRLKPEKCFFCGDDKTQAHHEDYNKPLNIIWLCRKCHMDLHNKKRGN